MVSGSVGCVGKMLKQKTRLGGIFTTNTRRIHRRNPLSEKWALEALTVVYYKKFYDLSTSISRSLGRFKFNSFSGGIESNETIFSIVRLLRAAEETKRTSKAECKKINKNVTEAKERLIQRFIQTLTWMDRGLSTRNYISFTEFPVPQFNLCAHTLSRPASRRGEQRKTLFFTRFIKTFFSFRKQVSFLRVVEVFYMSFALKQHTFFLLPRAMLLNIFIIFRSARPRVCMLRAQNM